MNVHVISQEYTLLEALKKINTLITLEPLVLFAIDENQHMTGTLTDGDIRRALIRGVKVEECVSAAMHRNFRFLRRGVDDDVMHLRALKAQNMKLVPILDETHRIVEIINLEKRGSGAGARSGRW